MAAEDDSVPADTVLGAHPELAPLFLKIAFNLKGE